MNLPTEFAESYPQCWPIGWKLRVEFAHRWFRIHSLPESKRYPEREAEYEEILSRHNQLASDVLGVNRRIFLFWYGFDLGEMRAGRRAATFREDGENCHIFMREDTWRAGAFDDIITDVADDKRSSVVFFDTENDSVYAPYDGGADVLVTDPGRLNHLKEEYRKWFSTHESGL